MDRAWRTLAVVQAILVGVLLIEFLVTEPSISSGLGALQIPVAVLTVVAAWAWFKRGYRLRQSL